MTKRFASLTFASASHLAIFAAACLLCQLLPGLARAQDVPLNGPWKFHTGDQAQWAIPTFPDSAWSAIRVGEPWETQGYKDYDGYAWYRIHVRIPSSIKEKAFLKEMVAIDLGKIDDGDQVYLNGVLIGQNGGKPGTIESGDWQTPRSYKIRVNDPYIRWDQDNVIAVRVFDHGGDGGMYEGKYGINMMDVTDFVRLNTAADDFHFAAGRRLHKMIRLESTSATYNFTGKLNIRIVEPNSGNAVFRQTLSIDFSFDHPFEYTYKADLPENRSYRVEYNFEEGRTGKLITASEGIPYILTPAPTAAPHINGAEVYGVRPGAAFLYKIAATGEKPLAYSASGLPPGLTLDTQTGLVTGSVAARGTYLVQVTVKNKTGRATRPLSIICGDKIGLTPALGWNSWNCWGLSVSDAKVRASAAAMAEKLEDHGWSYINIDDGWEDKRDGEGNILPNNKFPDMKALADHIHSLGLKIGIYSSPGPRTCGGFEGSYNHEDRDAATYARWGIDYLKYDWCSYGEIAPRAPSLDEYKLPYTHMRASLDKTRRDIIYSLCQYGMGDVWKWGAALGANSWRTTGDITDNWSSLSGIGFKQDICAPYTGPGHFNDPDMLVIGKVGWGPSLHNTRLTPDEQYTHISLWCLLSAPLLIGCDMSGLDDFTLGLLTNDEVLAIDQDAMANPAIKAWDKNGIQVWIKSLKDGSKAVGIFNLEDRSAKPAIPLSAIALPERIQARDCWRQQNLPPVQQTLTAELPAHGVLLLKVRAAH